MTGANGYDAPMDDTERDRLAAEIFRQRAALEALAADINRLRQAYEDLARRMKDPIDES